MSRRFLYSTSVCFFICLEPRGTLPVSTYKSHDIGSLFSHYYLSLTNCVTVSGAICRQIRGWACRSSTCIIVQIPAHFVRQHRFSLIKISVKRPPPFNFLQAATSMRNAMFCAAKPALAYVCPADFCPIWLGNYSTRHVRVLGSFTHFTSVWMPLTYILYFDLRSNKCVHKVASHTYSTIYYLPN